MTAFELTICILSAFAVGCWTVLFYKLWEAAREGFGHIAFWLEMLARRP
jgi:hypothetical protein